MPARYWLPTPLKKELTKLTEEERNKIQKSINEAQKALDDGLILDEEAKSTLYRMIFYYQDKLKEK